jgi:inositol phosphorylceramide mannosyltransferase catalytic subunit
MYPDDKIPRRIIQTGKSRDLPPLPRAAVTSLRLLHPNWEYMFFDDAEVEQFVATEFPQHVATFESFPHRIQRYDFFRYLAVFRLGGFYFDLDVFLAEELTPLLSHRCVFPFEELTLNRFLREQRAMDWEIGNYGFGASAGNPFIGAVIENCVRGQRDRAWVQPQIDGVPAPFRSRFEVLNTTGPGLLTRTLVEQPALAAGVKILYPDNVCDSSQWHRFGNFGVHLMEGTWRDRGSYLGCRLARLWENWTRRRFLVESRAIGKTRTFPSPKLA